MKLLDTSVAIDHLRGLPDAVELLGGLAEAEELLLASEVVRFELLAGARKGEIDPSGSSRRSSGCRSGRRSSERPLSSLGGTAAPTVASTMPIT